MRVFAIRHKPTGYYLPARKTRAGYSHDKPEPNGGKWGPRFFIDDWAAKCALTAWLQGQFTTNHNFTDGWSDDEISLKVVPMKDRKREEMEIVQFHLLEAEL